MSFQVYKILFAPRTRLSCTPAVGLADLGVNRMTSNHHGKDGAQIMNRGRNHWQPSTPIQHLLDKALTRSRSGSTSSQTLESRGEFAKSLVPK